MGAEYEHKFRADPACQKVISEAFADNWTSITMETTYYDTPDRGLSAKRYMLRRRLENGFSVCTLKAPGKGTERGEWEVNCPDISSAVPMLCKLGCPADLPILCKDGLFAICGARFTRQAKLLEFPDFTAELALDKGVLFSGNRELPLCEIEIELKAGSKAAMDAFSRHFAAKYGLQPEAQSKFARALSLYKEV